MRKIYIFLALLFASFSQVNAQYSFVSMYDGTFRVNSATHFSGKTRNTIRVQKPTNAVGYIIRATVVNKKTYMKPLASIVGKLAKFGASVFTSGASEVAQYAISNHDGNNLDFYMFTDYQQSQRFKATRSNRFNRTTFSYCKEYQSHSNFAEIGTECIYSDSSYIFIGCRNRNIRKGLNVRLEVVFITKKS